MGLENTLLVGTEFGYSYVTRMQYTGRQGNVSLLAPGDAAPATAFALSSDLSFREWREGHYLQDQLELLPGLKVMAGVRFDNIGRRMVENTTNTNQSQQNQAFGERAGVTYEAVRGVTVYGGYSHSFVPPGSTVSLGAVKGQLLAPETGDNLEAGVKVDLTDRLTTTAAVYQLTRENVVTSDPVTGYATTTGQQKSKGVELDCAALLAPGWNALFSYAYTDARVTRDATYLAGSMVDNVPLNSAHLWSVYEVQSGPAKGLGFGGGLTYVGKRQGVLTGIANPGADYALPDYATVDMAAYYQLENVRLSVNATNILDKRYYQASASSTSVTTVYAGQPASIIGRIGVSF